MLGGWAQKTIFIFVLWCGGVVSINYGVDDTFSPVSQYGLASGGCEDSFGGCVVEDTLVLPLVRSNAVISVSGTISTLDQSINDLSLFTGLIFHAINTMSGRKNSFLRGGFIPMLCYAMKVYLDENYARLGDEVLDQYRLFICDDIESFVRDMDDREGVNIERELKYLTTCLVGSISCVTSKDLGFLDERCEQIVEQCCKARAQEKLYEDTTFKAFMDEWVREYYRKNERHFSEKNRFIDLQMVFYQKVAESSNHGWFGLIPYYMLTVLRCNVRDGSYATKTNLCCWVECASFSESIDFFSSPEYVDCMKKYWESNKICCEIFPIRVYADCGDGSLCKIAQNQYETLCKKPVAFIQDLMRAFDLFQKRLSMPK